MHGETIKFERQFVFLCHFSGVQLFYTICRNAFRYSRTIIRQACKVNLLHLA